MKLLSFQRTVIFHVNLKGMVFGNRQKYTFSFYFSSSEFLIDWKDLPVRIFIFESYISLQNYLDGKDILINALKVNASNSFLNQIQ